MQDRILSEEVIQRGLGKKRQFVKKYCDSLLPLDSSSEGVRAILHSVAGEVQSGRYFPHPPRGYLTTEKHNGVPRFIPCFRIEDALVYFSCIHYMDPEIGIGRAKNTFGGWSIGSESDRQERDETRQLDEELLDSYSPYPFTTSLDPTLFRRMWRGFQLRALQYSRDDDFKVFAKIDIASFFDTIDLNRLERKLRASVPTAKLSTLDLLMLFLTHWNREVEGYGRKGVGIPLDEIGDNSRILANLFLQEYDKNMISFCAMGPSKRKYLRFVDDQILMAQNEVDLLIMVRFAAERLHQIGLSLNTAKVKIFESRALYDRFWCFDLIHEVTNDPESGARSYFALVDQDALEGRDRHISVLKALCWRLDDLPGSMKERVLNVVLSSGGLSDLDSRLFENFALYFSPVQRQLFLELAENAFMDNRFNETPLRLLRFFRFSEHFVMPDYAVEYVQSRKYEFKWL